MFRRGCRGIPEPNLRRRADPDQGPQETHRRLRHLARSQRLLLRRDGEVGARLALRCQARHGEQERRRRRWNRRSGSLHLSRELRYYHRLKVKQPHIFFVLKYCSEISIGQTYSLTLNYRIAVATLTLPNIMYSLPFNFQAKLSVFFPIVFYCITLGSVRKKFCTSLILLSPLAEFQK